MNVGRTLLVFARRELAGDMDAAAEAVLLEGSWPQGEAPARASLDDALDVRHAWIDDEAARLAELAAQGDSLLPARIDALALGYAAVKWLRVLAFFAEVRPVGQGDEVQLVATRARDEDYAELLDLVCRRAGAALSVSWVDRGPAPPTPVAGNPAWRRALGRLAGALDARLSPAGPRPRVVLCGNPRVLDPVCEELVGRGSAVWWLYDRFALRSWLRWRPRGVGQLVCDASLGSDNRLIHLATGPLPCRGFDLGPIVRQWIAGRLAATGARLTRLADQVARHFSRVMPAAVVLDEDATPLARIAVAAARRVGARSWVVQHGAPCVRFGFAPLEADRVCVWGESSARQLVRWGVPPHRIERTGSPWHEVLSKALTPAPSPTSGRGERRVLLLTTVPPRDDRPEPVSLHLTRSAYAAMVRMAFAAVARVPGTQLTVRLHPRAAGDAAVESAAAEFRQLHARVVRGGSLARCLAGCDCVLNCVSSAGIDAMLAGMPVIQLLPQGSGDVLPAGEWGFAGAARTREELDEVLSGVLASESRPHAGPDPRVFEPCDQPAAARIADAVLGDLATSVAETSKPLKTSEVSRTSEVCPVCRSPGAERVLSCPKPREASKP